MWQTSVENLDNESLVQKLLTASFMVEGGYENLEEWSKFAKKCEKEILRRMK